MAQQTSEDLSSDCQLIKTWSTQFFPQGLKISKAL